MSLLVRVNVVLIHTQMGFPDSSIGKESACNVGDPGLIPGLERSPGEGKGYPLQYSGLENSMDCRVHEVAKSRTQLSNFHSLCHTQVLQGQKELKQMVNSSNLFIGINSQ